MSGRGDIASGGRRLLPDLSFPPAIVSLTFYQGSTQGWTAGLGPPRLPGTWVPSGVSVPLVPAIPSHPQCPGAARTQQLDVSKASCRKDWKASLKWLSVLQIWLIYS